MSALSEAMEFDQVILIREDGTLDGNPQGHGLYAPEAYEPDHNATELDGWDLPLSGFTGQHGYRGPWLHDSELIAGAVEAYVLAHPGYWVAIYASYGPEDATDHDHDWADDICQYPTCDATTETIIEGWTLAFKPADVCPETPDGVHQITDGSCDMCGQKNFA